MQNYTRRTRKSHDAEKKGEETCKGQPFVQGRKETDEKWEGEFTLNSQGNLDRILIEVNPNTL